MGRYFLRQPCESLQDYLKFNMQQPSNESYKIKSFHDERNPLLAGQPPNLSRSPLNREIPDFIRPTNEKTI